MPRWIPFLIVFVLLAVGLIAVVLNSRDESTSAPITAQSTSSQATTEALSEPDGNLRLSADPVLIRTICAKMFNDITGAPAQSSIRFRLSSDEIRTASYAALDRLIEFTSDCPAASIKITGHSDASGNEQSNIDLSRRRARAVANYLTQRGAVENKFIVSGAGSSHPLADNATAHGRQKNRRIEFTLGTSEIPGA